MSDLVQFLQDGFEGNLSIRTLQTIARLSRAEAASFCRVTLGTFNRWRTDRHTNPAAHRLMAIRAGFMPWPGWEQFFFCNFDGRLYHEHVKHGFTPDDLVSLHTLKQEVPVLRAELEALRQGRDDLKWLSVYQAAMLDVQSTPTPSIADTPRNFEPDPVCASTRNDARRKLPPTITQEAQKREPLGSLHPPLAETRPPSLTTRHNRPAVTQAEKPPRPTQETRKEARGTQAEVIPLHRTREPACHTPAGAAENNERGTFQTYLVYRQTQGGRAARAPSGTSPDLRLITPRNNPAIHYAHMELATADPVGVTPGFPRAARRSK